MRDSKEQAGERGSALDQFPWEDSSRMIGGHTFTPGQGVVPVPVGAVLTCEDGVAHQLISREALEGH